jgi:hypothetical protein
MKSGRAMLILITGSGPGLGKSSLARGLSASFAANGQSTLLFREEEISSHPAFSALWEEFGTTGEVQLNVLLGSAAGFLHEMETSSYDIVVLDALLAYLPSLLAWGHSDLEIRQFFGRVAELLVSFEVIEIHLQGDLGAGLRRAAEREGGDWLDRFVTKVSSFQGAPIISSADDALSYWDALAARGERLLQTAPWSVEFVDTDGGEAAVLTEARAIILRLETRAPLA